MWKVYRRAAFELCNLSCHPWPFKIVALWEMVHSVPVTRCAKQFAAPDPAILAKVKGGSYAYCDADGNYYRSGFGLHY